MAISLSWDRGRTSIVRFVEKSGQWRYGPKIPEGHCRTPCTLLAAATARRTMG